MYWALPFIFSLCFPLNDRSRAAHSFFKISHLFSLSLFTCPSLALLRLLILLLLLMSGNVHPNPGPIFLCTVCTGNVTWWGKSVQCGTYSKWVHLSCSQLSLSKFKTLGSSHSWCCPSPFHNTLTPSSDSSDMYTSTVQSGPHLLILHSRPILVSKPLIPHLPNLYLPLLPHHRPLFLAVFPRLLPPLHLTLSGFFNRMLEVFKPRSIKLLYFLLSHPVNLISIHESNLNSSFSFPIPGFSALRSDHIHSRSGILPRDAMHANGALSSFSSGRTYPFLNFLPPLFLRLIPTLTM